MSSPEYVPIPSIHGVKYSPHVRSRGTDRAMFGSVYYAPGGTCGPRRQTTFQVVIIHQGEATIDIDKERQEVLSGQAILLKPGCDEFFQFARGEVTHHTWFSVSPRMLSTDFRRALNKVEPRAVATRRLNALIELGLSVPSVGEAPGDALVESLAEAAAREFFFEANRPERDEETWPAAVRQTREWIENHFGEEITLDSLAARCSVSPQHLTRLFKQHMQTTPTKYLWRVRVEQGVQFLRDTGLTVSEIAYHCGFKTPFHFSRMVRARYGATPSEIRRQRWEAV